MIHFDYFLFILYHVLFMQIRTMASGPAPGGMKFFLYAKTEDDMLMSSGGDLFLIQLVMESSSGNMTATIKASNTDSSLVAKLVTTLKKGLEAFSPN
jgi:hypothetical protein